MQYTYDIYLSGPMAGMPDNNHSDFLRAAANLQSCGYRVFNPAALFGGLQIMHRRQYQHANLNALLQSAALAALPGYELSAGALLELAVATELDIPTYAMAEPTTTPAQWTRIQGEPLVFDVLKKWSILNSNDHGRKMIAAYGFSLRTPAAHLTTAPAIATL